MNASNAEVELVQQINYFIAPCNRISISEILNSENGDDCIQAVDDITFTEALFGDDSAPSEE